MPPKILYLYTLKQTKTGRFWGPDGWIEMAPGALVMVYEDDEDLGKDYREMQESGQEVAVVLYAMR